MTTIKVQLYVNPSHTEIPLYFESAGQDSRAYLYLDLRDGELWVGCKAPWDNGMSEAEWDGDIKSFRIPNNLTEAGYNDLMTDKRVQAMCIEILAGSEQAEEDLRGFCDNQRFGGCSFGSLDVCGAGEYLKNLSFRECVKEGESIEDAIKRLINEAIGEGFYLGEGELERELEYKQQEEAESEDE